MSSARDRTLEHLKRLATAATVVSASTASIAACKKEPVKEGDGAASKDKDGGTTASVDLDATAPSTADSAAFVETTNKDAGDWRQPIPPTGYAVVDPMPPPTRIPPPRGDAGKDTCNPPFYYDAQGKKHYKKNCL